MFGLCTSTPTLSLMSFYYCGMRNNDGGFFFWWWKKKEKLTMLFIGTNQKVVLVAGNFFLTFFFSSLALEICALCVKRHHLTTTLLLFRMYLRHGQILSTGYNQLGMSCLFLFHFVNHCNIFFFFFWKLLPWTLCLSWHQSCTTSPMPVVSLVDCDLNVLFYQNCYIYCMWELL